MSQAATTPQSTITTTSSQDSWFGMASPGSKPPACRAPRLHRQPIVVCCRVQHEPTSAMMPLYALRGDAQLFCLRAPTADMGSLRVGAPTAGSVRHTTYAHLRDETNETKTGT
jgi:hypothetical protein